jgi:hypothetical protein
MVYWAMSDEEREFDGTLARIQSGSCEGQVKRGSAQSDFGGWRGSLHALFPKMEQQLLFFLV